MAEPGDRPLPDGRVSTFRHPAAVRLTHWLNVLAVLVLLTSGLQIYNAHPSLDWGQQTPSNGPHWLDFGAFPSWATLPPYQDLATGRRWHLAFSWLFLINGLIYLGYNLISGRFRRRLAPGWPALRGIWGTIKEHARFHFPKGEEARAYNVLQQLTYLGVVLVVLPLMILTGLTMSPGFNAIAPGLLDLFGGRQSARTLHFISAALLVGFIVLHVVLVVLAGFWNNMRSMVTGRFNLEPDPAADPTEMREPAA